MASGPGRPAAVGPFGGVMHASVGWVGGTTLRLVKRGGSGSGPRFAQGREPAEVPTRQEDQRGFARENGAWVCVRCPAWWPPAPRRARTPTRGKPRAGARPPAHRAIPSDGPPVG